MYTENSANDLNQSVHKLTRFCCREQIQRLVSGTCFVYDQMEQTEEDYSSYASIMLMAGSSFRINLTLFYHSLDLYDIASKHSHIPLLEFSRAQLQDFIEELCNVIIGQISRQLMDAGIETRIGLPMASKGFGAPGVQHLTSLNYFEISTPNTIILGKSIVYSFPDEKMPDYSFNEFKLTEQNIEDFFDFV